MCPCSVFEIVDLCLWVLEEPENCDSKERTKAKKKFEERKGTEDSRKYRTSQMGLTIFYLFCPLYSATDSRFPHRQKSEKENPVRDLLGTSHAPTVSVKWSYICRGCLVEAFQLFTLAKSHCGPSLLRCQKMGCFSLGTLCRRTSENFRPSSLWWCTPPCIPFVEIPSGIKSPRRYSRRLRHGCPNSTHASGNDAKPGIPSADKQRKFLFMLPRFCEGETRWWVLYFENCQLFFLRLLYLFHISSCPSLNLALFWQSASPPPISRDRFWNARREGPTRLWREEKS